MTKYIGCIGEDRAGTIKFLRVHEGGRWSTQQRQRVVADIEAGALYRTWVSNATTGKYEAGPRVHLFRVRGGKYLRTDANSIGRDNLGRLHALDRCPF